MEEEVVKKKVNYFYEKKIPVHIEKNNGFVNNGLILELAGDMIILDDLKNGAMPIYFIEIKEIEPKRENKKWE